MDSGLATWRRSGMTRPRESATIAHAQEDSHRRRLHASLAPYRLCARHHAGGDYRRRSGGGRFLCRLSAAESFPRHFRRRRVQCRLHPGLCAHSHPGWCVGGEPLRRSHFHAPSRVAACAAGAGAFIHAAGDRTVGARLLARAAAIRARGIADADHLSLSSAHHARDAVEWHPQRTASLRGGSGGADPAQCRDDGDAGYGVVVPERGPRRGLGRADIWRVASRFGWRRHLLRRRHDVVPRAALGRRRAALLQGASSGDHRIGRHPAGAVR